MNCQQDGKVLMRDLQYVDLEDRIASAYRVHSGDILFNRTNSYELVGRSAIVDEETNAVFASYLVRVTVDQSRLQPRYLNYFLNWSVAQSELKKLASRGVSQANISASKLRDFAIPVPPTVAEQVEIVAILDALRNKIALHQLQAVALDDLFKSMLHNLLSGDIRADELDTSILLPSENEKDGE
jgi:type I restriction enzyme S subunit